MEKQKSKIHEITKKISHQCIKLDKYSPQQITNHYYLTSSKKSSPCSPLKSTRNRSNYVTHKLANNNKKYAFNKTTYGTPYEMSTILSYISTPNENSITKNKLKKYKSNKNVSTKIVQIHQSTQDQNLSEQQINVVFQFNKKKIGNKKFMTFQRISSIHNQMVSLLKTQKNFPTNCYAMIGLDPIPYNHGLRLVLNNKNTLINTILSQKFSQITIQPILVPEKPNFENIELKNFQILKHLGSGGFSNVYLAKCEIDQKICALKFIKKNSITTVKKIKMLQNQKQILFTIDSPHLVDLLYAFQSNNYIIFGLEYCENGNLYNFLQKHKKIQEIDAKLIFKEILEGLEYLHQNNILFRDLKLQNILFDQKGKLKITDFGLSKPQISQEDITYSYCGSPQYMAPQMLAKCGHSFKVDYYALGILLYELLYGISPFYAPKKEDIFMAILNLQPKFPKEPQVSKQVKDLIRGLITKNPDHRIGSLKGVEEIKNHPWLRNSKQYEKSQVLNFPYQSLKISSKQLKQLKQTFRIDLSDNDYKKCFFPKSFVNKKLIDDLIQNMVIFPRKKQKIQKMIKSKSRNKTHVK